MENRCPHCHCQQLKDHEIARLINQLRDVAKEYAQAQQLRSRISRIIVPIFKQQ